MEAQPKSSKNKKGLTEFDKMLKLQAEELEKKKFDLLNLEKRREELIEIGKKQVTEIKELEKLLRQKEQAVAKTSQNEPIEADNQRTIILDDVLIAPASSKVTNAIAKTSRNKSTAKRKSPPVDPIPKRKKGGRPPKSLAKSKTTVKATLQQSITEPEPEPMAEPPIVNQYLNLTPLQPFRIAF